jgi:hypothetical protein
MTLRPHNSAASETISTDLCLPVGTATGRRASGGCPAASATALNQAAYLARLIRPDRALFEQERKRSWVRRLFCWGNRDERLRQLFSRAPYADGEAEWFMEIALEWTHDYILPTYQGDHDAPQTAAQTLDELAGDCEDGAILLGCMLVSGLLYPSRARFCVGTVDGERQHAFLTWHRKDMEDVVLLDWTISPRPMGADEIKWKAESEVVL